MKKRLDIDSKLDTIIKRLDKVDAKLSTIKNENIKLEKEEKLIGKEDKRIEKKENQIQKEESKIEKGIFQIGKFTFKRNHLMLLIRGTAGSFLGVGLGRSLLNMEDLANKLSWWNILGILLFILIISGLLIYKNEKDFVKKEGTGVIWRRLIALYLIALIVEFIALWLFSSLPTNYLTLIKVLVIGSYAAMAGAVSFSLV
ncbi:MAG: hypothetical protein WCV90_02335 [Candidatus Woesearchaeota archaeon]|jgi:hypothetical protein